MDESVNNRNQSRATNRTDVRFDGIGRTGAIVLACVAGLALGAAIYSQIEQVKSERETRMLEYYVMELDGKLMKSGFLNPDDSWSAQKRKREQESKP